MLRTLRFSLSPFDKALLLFHEASQDLCKAKTSRQCLCQHSLQQNVADNHKGMISMTCPVLEIRAILNGQKDIT